MSAADNWPAQDPHPSGDIGLYDTTLFAGIDIMDSVFDFDAASCDAPGIPDDARVASSSGSNIQVGGANVDNAGIDARRGAMIKPYWPGPALSHQQFDLPSEAGTFEQPQFNDEAIQYVQPPEAGTFEQSQFNQATQYSQQPSYAPEYQIFQPSTSQTDLRQGPLNAFAPVFSNNFDSNQVQPPFVMADGIPGANRMPNVAAINLSDRTQTADPPSTQVKRKAKPATQIAGAAGEKKLTGSEKAYKKLMAQELDLVKQSAGDSICKQKSNIKDVVDLYRQKPKVVIAPKKDEMFADADNNSGKYVDELLLALVSKHRATTMPDIGGKAAGEMEGVTQSEANEAFEKWQIDHLNQFYLHLVPDPDKQEQPSAKEQKNPAEQACILILQTCLNLHDCGIPDIAEGRSSKIPDLSLSFEERFNAIKKVIEELALVRSDVVRSCFIPDLVLNPVGHRNSKLMNFKGNVLKAIVIPALKAIKEAEAKAAAKAGADSDTVAGSEDDGAASSEQNQTPPARAPKRKQVAQGTAGREKIQKK